MKLGLRRETLPTHKLYIIQKQTFTQANRHSLLPVSPLLVQAIDQPKDSGSKKKIGKKLAYTRFVQYVLVKTQSQFGYLLESI